MAIHQQPVLNVIVKVNESYVCNIKLVCVVIVLATRNLLPIKTQFIATFQNPLGLSFSIKYNINWS